MSRKIILATTTGCLVIAGLLFSQNTTSLSATESCKDIQIVFARGSGQDLNDDDAAAFFSKIKERLPEQLSFGEYDLGKTRYGSYKYPAIDIGDLFIQVRAKISAGYSYEYGDSVKEGVNELKYYLNQQSQTCPETKYVLGGFSQGAQVIGQSFNHLSEEIRDKIVFAALFGDPKLHLPEGKGLFPPACSGKDLSTWRRIVEVCTTSAGALEERDPYIPNDMKDKVGTWCLSQDYICGSTNLPWEVSGHDKYKESGGPIEKAAQEIAQKLKTAFTYQSHKGTIKTAPQPQQKPLMKDTFVLFIVDRTVAMQSDYPQHFLPKMRQLAQSLGSQATIGFDGYTGCWRDDDYEKGPQSVLLSEYKFYSYQQWQAKDREQANWVSVDTFGVQKDLPYYAVEPGCDVSWELGIHTWRAVKNFHQSNIWFSGPRRPIWSETDGIKRIIVPITNTAYTPNDTPLNGNNGLFTQAALNQPEVSIYPLVPDEIRHTFKSLEDLGDVEVHLVDDDKIADDILKTAKNPQLEARLSNTHYKIEPNSTVTFDASSSLVYDDTITKYDWDFEGDGVVDIVTSAPSVSHTYAAQFPHTASVKITSETGLTADASAQIESASSFDNTPKPNPPINLTLDQTTDREVNLAWNTSDDLADKWLIFVNDLLAGYVEKDQRSINITDLRLDESTTFAVQALSDNNVASEKTTISLPSQKQTASIQRVSLPTSTKNDTSFATLPKSPNTFSNVLGATTTIPKPIATNSHPVQARNNSDDIAYFIAGISFILVGVSMRIVYLRYHRHHSNVN